MTTRILNDEINSLPLFYYEGKVSLVRTQEDCLCAVEQIKKHTAIGVDTETRPSFAKGKSYPPSLIQIAIPDAVFLFHLAWVRFDALLASIFEDKRIVKTGVAVRDDLRCLEKLYPFTPHAVFDLSTLAKANGIATQSLRGLAGHLLQVRISKGERCSNWSNKELSPKQIRYAATDAWASLAIYQAMREQGFVVRDNA